MLDIIIELWTQAHIATSIQWNIICILTLITRKLQVVCGRSSYRTTPLLLEMYIFCVRAGCEIQLASYCSKYALQSLCNKPFVHTYIHNVKSIGHTWTFCISNDCSSIRDIPCVVQSWMRDLTGELQQQTHTSCSLTQYCVHTLQGHPYIATWV